MARGISSSPGITLRTEAHLRGVGRGCADTVLEGSNKTSVLETDREFLVEVALALPVPEGLSKELHVAWTRPNYRMYRRRMNQRIPMKASATPKRIRPKSGHEMEAAVAPLVRIKQPEDGPDMSQKLVQMVSPFTYRCHLA